MTTIDLAPNSTCTIPAAMLTAVGDPEAHDHVATATCAHQGCSLLFLGRGDVDAADVQAEAEGWTIDGPDAFCPLHTP